MRRSPPSTSVRTMLWLRSDIDLRTCTEAVAIDLQRKRLSLSTGEVLAYDTCLVASGGEATRLAALPEAHPGVHYLRTLADARRLRDAIRKKPRLAVLGGGFLGLEVAHAALAHGCEVKVLERAPAILDRFLPREASDWVERKLRARGAQLSLHTTLGEVHPLANGDLRLMTGAGAVDVDDLVVAIGLVPNDKLGQDAGLEIAPGGGILVDESCRTSDQHVFACGDCTSQRRYGQAAPSRLESWQNANEQARTLLLPSSAPSPNSVDSMVLDRPGSRQHPGDRLAGARPRVCATRRSRHRQGRVDRTPR